MDNWNYDLSACPEGSMIESTYTREGKSFIKTEFVPYKVCTASKCGKILLSGKLQNGRWEFYTRTSPPIAWMDLPLHPHINCDE